MSIDRGRIVQLAAVTVQREIRTVADRRVVSAVKCPFRPTQPRSMFPANLTLTNTAPKLVHTWCPAFRRDLLTWWLSIRSPDVDHPRRSAQRLPMLM
jgi:hypothetical protein